MALKEQKYTKNVCFFIKANKTVLSFAVLKVNPKPLQHLLQECCHPG